MEKTEQYEDLREDFWDSLVDDVEPVDLRDEQDRNYP